MHDMDIPDETTSLCIGEELLTLNGRPKHKAAIPLDALTRHMCILGTTGAGKSTCAEIVCHELARLHVPTLVLDRTGEYVSSLGKLPGVNTLTPGENLVICLFKRKDERPDNEAFPLGAQIEDWVSLLDHFLHTSYSAGLSPLQARVLREVFEQYCHGARQPLTITNLILKLREYEDDVADFRGWPESIEAIVSRLVPMTVGVVGKALDRSYETFKIDQLFEPGLNIIDLSVIPEDGARNLLSQVVLKEVYDVIRRKEKTGALRLVVLLDEAQYLAPNDRGYISIPERCAIELRKYGFCLAVCATRPSLISPDIIANSNTLISFMLNNQDDIDTVAGFMVGGAAGGHIKETLRKLPVGEALLQLNHPQPRDAARCRIGTESQRLALGLSYPLEGQ